jgi:hypothetical protein
MAEFLAFKTPPRNNPHCTSDGSGPGHQDLLSVSKWNANMMPARESVEHGFHRAMMETKDKEQPGNI